MEFDNSIPIYIQIIDRIKKDLVTGIIKPGEKMLSARDLAKEMGINPNTAARVYNEMEREGLCFTKRGIGTFMTEDERRIKIIKHEMAEKLINEFVKGMSELGFTQEELIDLIKKNNAGGQK